MKVAVIRFPGSNCDAETLRAATSAGANAYYVWHRESDLADADVVIIPGGFSYGDYLRAGAIARFSEVMPAVYDHVTAGGMVFGICNGFQVLCEARLLPGALMRNADLRFVSRPVSVRVESTDTPFTSAYEKGAILQLPVAHGEGRYVAHPEVIEQLENDERVVLRYFGENPNGSLNDIAGITNAERTVVGIMPHPERAADPAVGRTDGADVFNSMMHAVELFGGAAR